MHGYVVDKTYSQHRSGNSYYKLKKSICIFGISGLAVFILPILHIGEKTLKLLTNE